MSATPAAVRTAVELVDITLPVPGQEHPVRAWLVRGADRLEHGRPRPAVLWLHWLGHRHNDRGEYLPLAVELASRGAVSLLPAGVFPWVPDPDGTATDLERVRDQVAAHVVALDHLIGEPDVDPDRVALVGHDYGGMYGALLAADDPRISTMALQAVDSSWGNWFSTYWLKLEGDARADYSARFSGIEPLPALERSAGRLGDRLLLQWAGDDTFVTPETRAAYERAAPRARSIDYPRADHMLDDRASAELLAFLVERLGLDES